METHEVVEELPGEARAQPAPLHRAEKEVGAPDHQISCSPGEHASCLCVCPQGAAARQVLRALSSQWAALLHRQGAASPYRYVSVLPLSHPSPTSP